MKPVRSLQKKLKSPSWMVYILRCSDDSLYTGITNNLARRLAAHQSGTASRYTRSRTPVKLVYTESVGSKSSALRREVLIKQMRRQQKVGLVDG